MDPSFHALKRQYDEEGAGDRGDATTPCALTSTCLSQAQPLAKRQRQYDSYRTLYNEPADTPHEKNELGNFITQEPDPYNVEQYGASNAGTMKRQTSSSSLGDFAGLPKEIRQEIFKLAVDAGAPIFKIERTARNYEYVTWKKRSNDGPNLFLITQLRKKVSRFAMFCVSKATRLEVEWCITSSCCLHIPWYERIEIDSLDVRFRQLTLLAIPYQNMDAKAIGRSIIRLHSNVSVLNSTSNTTTGGTATREVTIDLGTLFTRMKPGNNEDGGLSTALSTLLKIVDEIATAGSEVKFEFLYDRKPPRKNAYSRKVLENFRDCLRSSGTPLRLNPRYGKSSDGQIEIRKTNTGGTHIKFI